MITTLFQTCHNNWEQGQRTLPGIGLTTTLLQLACRSVTCVPIQRLIVIVVIYHVAALFKWLHACMHACVFYNSTHPVESSHHAWCKNSRLKLTLKCIIITIVNFRTIFINHRKIINSNITFCSFTTNCLDH